LSLKAILKPKTGNEILRENLYNVRYSYPDHDVPVLKHSQIHFNLLTGGLRVQRYSMYHLWGELTVIPMAMWCLRKLGRDCRWLNKRHRNSCGET